MTSRGELYACGIEEITGLTELQSKSHRPHLVPGLEDVFIQNIDVGAEHILALTDKGQVKYFVKYLVFLH